MTPYEPVIGLEIHVQLATATKMFCKCPNRFGDPPNTNTCPVCLGLPGSLPVLNRKAVELAVRVGLSLHGEIRARTKFDRKNYFYPDLPKNYQISQYDVPLCKGGYVEIGAEGSERITLLRAHLEEDAGKLVHGQAGEDTRVDLNRAGVPLLEIVTDPVIRTPAQAHAFLTALRQILVYLGVSDCEMQKGSLRVDTNISLRPQGTSVFGARVEIKNLNSFRGVEKALAYETARQEEILRGGGQVVQETRSFDLEKGTTASMRSKEAVADYRYFPEPDLPPLSVPPAWVDAIRREIPELPRQKRERFVLSGIPERQASILTAEPEMAAFYSSTAAIVGADLFAEAANWITGDIRQVLNETQCGWSALRLTPRGLAVLILAVKRGEITRLSGKEALAQAAATGTDPAEMIRTRGLAQISDAGALEEAARKVLAAQPRAVADYRSGKGNALTFLVGAVMKETRGKANPAMVRPILERMLSGESA